MATIFGSNARNSVQRGPSEYGMRPSSWYEIRPAPLLSRLHLGLTSFLIVTRYLMAEFAMVPAYDGPSTGQAYIREADSVDFAVLNPCPFAGRIRTLF